MHARAPETSVWSLRIARRASAIIRPSKTIVIAGLDPAIHLVKRMDTRVKPAYDTITVTFSVHFRQPRGVTRHQIDLEIDLAAGAPGAKRRDIEGVRNDQHRKQHVMHRIHR